MVLAAYTVGIILLIALTFLSYWRGNEVFWMITAGIAMMVGLYTPDALGALNYSSFGVGVGILIIMYSFLCIGLAYANLFKEEENE